MSYLSPNEIKPLRVKDKDKTQGESSPKPTIGTAQQLRLGECSRECALRLFTGARTPLRLCGASAQGQCSSRDTPGECPRLSSAPPTCHLAPHGGHPMTPRTADLERTPWGVSSRLGVGEGAQHPVRTADRASTIWKHWSRCFTNMNTFSLQG